MKEALSYLRFGAPDNWRDSLDDKGGWIEYPSFHEVLWPFLEGNGQMMPRVYLFDHRDSKLGELSHREFKDTPLAVRGKFTILPGLSELNEPLTKLISVFSYDLLFNVLFETSGTAFLTKLSELFPFESIFEIVDERMFNNEDIQDITALLSELPSDTFLFAFAHDADYLAIFGDYRSLGKIQETHRVYLRDRDPEAGEPKPR